jgi:competence protein ComEA
MKVNKHTFFTITERRALVIIALFVAALMAVLYYIYKYDKPSEVEIKSILNDTRIEEDVAAAVDINKSQKHKIPKFFKFNPNIINEDSLLMLGVDKKTASNLIKYRNKGGVIKTKEFFFKIYGMEKYKEKLDSLITIPQMEVAKKNEYKKDTFTKNKSYPSMPADSKSSGQFSSNANYATNKANKIPIVTLKSVEINTADSLALVQLNGVGPVLSKMIIKYREKLGGYYEIEQLEEVWGMRPESFLNINHLFTIDESKIRKIKMNSASVEELGKHPYIGKRMAPTVIKYKENHGPFKNMEDVKNIKIFDEENLGRLKHYLSFE